MAYQRTPYVESKRAEARDRCLQAALAMLARGGWREVQMSAVAQEAGLSTGALYLHFPSKTQLLVALYQHQAGNELAVTAAIAAQPLPARERLAKAIGAFAQRAISGGRLAYAMVLEPVDAEVEEVRLRFHADFIEQFRRILDDGNAAGEFQVGSPRVAAACVFGAITESLMQPLGLTLQTPGPRGKAARHDVAALVEPLLAFCFHGLGSAAPAAKRAPARRRG